MPRNRGKKSRNEAPATVGDITSLRKQVAKEFNGFTFRPNPAPPPFTQAPWNHLVVAQSVATPTDEPRVLSYNINAIWSAAQLQLGFGKTSVPAELRFVRVEAWATADASNLAVAMFVFDVTDVTGNTRLFARIEDHCAKNQWARVGYEWPRSIQNITNESASQAPVFQVRANAGAVNYYTRVHLLWRATDGAAPSLYCPLPRTPASPSKGDFVVVSDSS